MDLADTEKIDIENFNTVWQILLISRLDSSLLPATINA